MYEHDDDEATFRCETAIALAWIIIMESTKINAEYNAECRADDAPSMENDLCYQVLFTSSAPLG